MQLQDTYWNGCGKYQKELDELTAAGITVRGARTYYRFYNDGDAPRGIKGFPMFGREVFLERWIDGKIMEAWKKYKGVKNG
jgi:hypothetical protein